MAHGIIPPFSTHLICEDFLNKVLIGAPLNGDIVLLGEASNEVLVTQEVAEGFQELLAQAYALYLATGYTRLDVDHCESSPASRAVLALLMGIALGVNGASDAFRALRSSLQGGSGATWESLVMGALRLRIQAIENEIGVLIREDAKDVYTHAPEQGSMEELERALCAA